MLINTLYSNSTHLKANANKRKLEEKEIEQSIKDYVDPYLDRLDAQIKKFGFNVKYVGLDAGYFTNPIFKGISDRNIVSAIAT